MAKHSYFPLDLDTGGTSGVYTIENTATGRLYIGSTTRSFFRRWQIHRARLRHNKHHNKQLQADWLTYGEQAFIFTIITYCEYPHTIEITLIDNLRTIGETPYNAKRD